MTQIYQVSFRNFILSTALQGLFVWTIKKIFRFKIHNIKAKWRKLLNSLSKTSFVKLQNIKFAAKWSCRSTDPKFSSQWYMLYNLFTWYSFHIIFSRSVDRWIDNFILPNLQNIELESMWIDFDSKMILFCIQRDYYYFKNQNRF